MADKLDDYDDARYQHHLQHRGATNHMIFWVTWTIITTVLILHGCWRILDWWHRKRDRVSMPGKLKHRVPLGSLLRLVHLANILPLPSRLHVAFPSYSIGRVVLTTGYIVTISMGLTLVGASFMSQHFLDDVAFRAAWLTVSQVPLVYLLSTKRGPVNIIAGLSYIRVNWMHRWVGRVLFVSATLHAAIMKSSIPTSEIVLSDNKGMATVRQGIGAYATLVWIVVTAILPLRRWSYRVFYLNHCISTIGFLLIAVQHVPSYARTSIYMAMSFVAMDKCLVACTFIRNNFSLRPHRRGLVRFRHGPSRGKLVAGYQIEMVAPASSALALPPRSRDDTTIIRILNLPITWRPGQHIRLHLPALGVFESHPFTPANSSAMPPPPLPPRKDIEQPAGTTLSSSSAQRSDMLLTVRTKSGLTMRLAEYYMQWLSNPCPNASQLEEHLVGFVDGPYGNPPEWNRHENLVLIAASTGVSFILSIVDHLEQLCFVGMHTTRTRTIRFVWMLRHFDTHLEHFVENLLSRYSTTLRESGIHMKAEIHITCSDSEMTCQMKEPDPFLHLRQQVINQSPVRPELIIRHPDEIYDEWDREAELAAKGFHSMEPSITELYSGESLSFESDVISEVETLVDDESDDERESDPLTETYISQTNDDAYRPLPPTSSHQHIDPRVIQTRRDECQCVLIRHQREKLKVRKTHEFITVHHGRRPDLESIITNVDTCEIGDSTMVAVCANGDIVRQARASVAALKGDVAFRRKRNAINIFIEGMG
ncbi:ferric-chelate reductase Frp1 [Coniothyrium glycines]